MNNEGYTPEKIVSDNLFFEIPLYQRLFEWQDVQIKQLMNDLYSEFSKQKEASRLAEPSIVNESEIEVFDKPYYIGMLTSKHNSTGRFDLIDGQQRMTVLMLMGIVFHWDGFLRVAEKVRLSFFARPKDKLYLESLILGKKSDYVNVNMKRGKECIESYISNIPPAEKLSFGNYIYRNLTLFIYDLPVEYEQSDLNRYFESMNSTGKSLENHEILKVNLLKSLDKGLSINQYTRIWNAVAEMDKPLLRQRSYKIKGKIEGKEEFQRRCKEAIQQALNSNPSVFFEPRQGYSLINDLYADDSVTEETDNSQFEIKDIPASATPPSKYPFSRDNRSFLSFPEFLLEVLYLTLDKAIGSYNKTDFFNIHKLQETFDAFKEQVKADVFIRNLLFYRLLLDVFFIKINNDESGYSLDDFVGIPSDENINESKMRVIQYQSMLYVSSTTLSYYLWVAPLLKRLKEEIGKGKWMDAREMLSLLKYMDNNRPGHDIGSLKLDSLTYHTVDRYWFWRLDYYLWEKRKDFFTEKARTVADNYIFRTSRSIEHVAPQTPQHDSKLKWNDNDEQDRQCRDCFGNLAMISSSQNSSLRNESYEVKHAYIKSFINISKTGSVESLKLLKIFEDFGEWDKGKINEHNMAMFKILTDSYSLNNVDANT